MEWDTPPLALAGQGPRMAQIPSVSGRLTSYQMASYQMAMAFDTTPKPPSTVPTGASFLAARPVGQSVFIPSPTKVPAPTRCEQRTLSTAVNTAWAHALQTGAAHAKMAERCYKYALPGEAQQDHFSACAPNIGSLDASLCSARTSVKALACPWLFGGSCH